MNRPLLLVMAIALVLIGPVMFMLSRAYALDSAFKHIHRGESQSAVQAVMGRPQRQIRHVPPAKVDLEYRYSVWPLSGAWVIEFADGRVIATRRT